MEAPTRGVLVLALLLGGVMASTQALKATSESGCAQPKSIPFARAPRATLVIPGAAAKDTGLLSIYGRLHRAFGAFLAPSGVPQGLRHADRVDFKYLMALARSSTGSVVLLYTSICLAVAVPVVGLIAVLRAREAIYSQAETERQAASRVKTSLGLWILIASLAFMSIGALLTVQHVTVAQDAATKQGHFLADTMAEVSQNLINDLYIVSGPNIAELSKALDQRLRDCSNEVASTIDHVVANDGLLKFTATAAERLMKIKKLLNEVKRVANNDNLKGVASSVRNASQHVSEAIATCHGSCHLSLLQNLRSKLAEQDPFLEEIQMKFPASVRDLKEKLDINDMAALQNKIPSSQTSKDLLEQQAKGVRRDLHQLADTFNLSTTLLKHALDLSVETASHSVLLMDNMAKNVRVTLDLYKFLVLTVTAVTTIVLGLYVLGNQTVTWRASTGRCRFATASMSLSVAVFLFFLCFPIFMVSAAMFTTTSVAAQRKLCMAAEDLGAPSSSSFVELLANRLGSKAVNGSAALSDAAASEPSPPPCVACKVFTPKAWQSILVRFAECSNAKLSFADLLGKDLMAELVRALFGNDSPWVEVLTEEAGRPALAALDMLGRDWPVPQLGEAARRNLTAFAQTTISAGTFQNFSIWAKNAKNRLVAFQDIHDQVKRKVTRFKSSVPELTIVARDLDQVIQRRAKVEAEMDKIDRFAQVLVQMANVAGQSLQVFLKDNMDNWDRMKIAFDALTKQIRSRAEGTKRGFEHDIQQFFRHTAVHIRHDVGDCRHMYLLYKSTVEAVCGEGVNLFVTFWSSIMWYLILGVPCSAGAFVLASHFARCAAHPEVTKNVTKQGHAPELKSESAKRRAPFNFRPKH
ncbi:uncharacterized protein LOC142591371 [Dermacentor variabilis]|uniref:uncharacterized protein LOC142591371 n=1 Tax=Dermacentor variabilis TaxID=34621 RepID=UPI003F5C90C0